MAAALHAMSPNTAHDAQLTKTGGHKVGGKSQQRRNRGAKNKAKSDREAWRLKHCIMQAKPEKPASR
jgi:hypothetical protein